MRTFPLEPYEEILKVIVTRIIATVLIFSSLIHSLWLFNVVEFLVNCLLVCCSQHLVGVGGGFTIFFFSCFVKPSHFVLFWMRLMFILICIKHGFIVMNRNRERERENKKISTDSLFLCPFGMKKIRKKRKCELKETKMNVRVDEKSVNKEKLHHL